MLEAERAGVEAAGVLLANPETHGEAPLRSLDNALSYAHRTLNALLRHSRAPTHDPRDVEAFCGVVTVPFQEVL